MATRERSKTTWLHAGKLLNNWGVYGTNAGTSRAPDYWSSRYFDLADAWAECPRDQSYQVISNSTTQRGFKDVDHFEMTGFFPQGVPSYSHWTNDFWNEDALDGNPRRFGRDKIDSHGMCDYARNHLGMRRAYEYEEDPWKDLDDHGRHFGEQALARCPQLPDPVEQLCARAITEMAPAIASRMNLLETVVELRDLKSIVTAPIKLLRAIRNLKRFNGKSLKGLAKAVAEGHLTYAFAYKPAVADLEAIYHAMVNIRAELDALLAKAGTRQTRHWRVAIDPFEQESDESGDLDTNWSYRYRTSVVATTEFNVTMRYTYDLVDVLGRRLSKRSKGLEALARLDALGVNLNLANLWDLVPFSFVLDWFVSVDRWLDSFSKKNIQPVVTVEDCCYSIKRQFSEVRSDTVIAHTVFRKEETSIGVFHTKSYERRVFTPRASWLHEGSFDTTVPSWKQWLLGGSLIVANA